MSHLSKMPTVSVIIPVYKAAAFLAATLDSVLEQTLTDFEVLCVDDSSPDNSVAVINQYILKDSRLKLIQHPKNMGSPAFGRNSGLAQAKGEFVSFLDHDDTFLPTKLAELIQAMKRERVDFICSNIYLVSNQTGKRDGLAWGQVKGDPKEGFRKRLLQGNFVPPNSTLIRRSVFEQVGRFDTSLKGADDFEMWYRIARLFPCTIYNQPLATWRYLNQSSLSANDQLMIEDELRFYEQIIQNHPWSADEKEEAARGVIRNQRRLANRLLSQKKYRQARALYQKTGTTWILPWLSILPSVPRFLYLAKNRGHKFQPLVLNFEQ